MKKIIFSILTIFLALQAGIFLFGCGGNNSSRNPSSQMAGKSAISIVVKDAATGSKLPMTGVFVNSASLTKASGLRARAAGSWAETKTNNMGYAEITDVSPNATVMIKISNAAGSYEEYSKVISTGKNIGGYTIYLTTDEAAAPAYDTFFDPTGAPSGGAGSIYACKDAGTCMACGCAPSNGTACGAGCGCTDPNTNCNGGQCRTAAGVGNFGKCSDAGCPPGCKNCGACACATGNCGGSANCQIAVNPGGAGTGEASGACKDGACPPGCSGCGACICSSAGSCGGSANCVGASQVSFEATPGGSGKCNDNGCPTGCRNCGACECSTAGSCGGSTNCVSGTGGGGGGTPGGGGSVGPGCSGASCPQSCANSPCGACNCVAGSSAPCGAKGGKSYCQP